MHRAFLLLPSALLIHSAGLALGAEQGEVWKSPTCGCCKAWVSYMQIKGFDLKVSEVNQSKLDELKAAAGVSKKFAGCHSARIGGYMIEGHVPAADVAKLLADKPDAIGLSVPGMPEGSPGMETDGTIAPFEVHLMKKDGSSEIYSRYGADAKF